MGGFIAALLLAAGLWRGWIDWQATIGEGYAYRLASIGTVLRETWPQRFAEPPAAQGTPGEIAAILFGLPLAPALILLAAVAWLLRRPGRR